jgi:methylenetetrahydrofolate dehydrogenase (NADP+) / methenyltetrahydrofolate cyclohydrolase
MIVDGRAIASEILKEVETSLKGRRPLVRIIVMQPSPATESYLRIKEARAYEAGIDIQLIRVENDGTTEDVIHKIKLEGADAIVVQLPLPSHVETESILSAIPIQKDVDVLSGGAYKKFEDGDEEALTPPVAGAVEEILRRSGAQVSGKRAVVVGQGRLVGKPVLALLRRMGTDAISIYKETPTPETILREADIIVSGAGAPHFITPDMIKEGAVLIDAGTSELNGALAGDFHPDCVSKASVFTPVPGGVGPVAVAMLFKNVASLHEGI